MHVLTTHTHTHTHTHTAYQLAVGVNCVGPQGKNNIAPKTDRVCSVFQQPTLFHENKTPRSCYNHATHSTSFMNTIIITHCISYILWRGHSCCSFFFFPGFSLFFLFTAFYPPVNPNRQCFHDYMTVNC